MKGAKRDLILNTWLRSSCQISQDHSFSALWVLCVLPASGAESEGPLFEGGPAPEVDRCVSVPIYLFNHLFVLVWTEEYLMYSVITIQHCHSYIPANIAPSLATGRLCIWLLCPSEAHHHHGDLQSLFLSVHCLEIDFFYVLILHPAALLKSFSKSSNWGFFFPHNHVIGK